ncbi:Lsr2 family protein [Streptomyces sp. NP160]|uniref:histone-like nucleoid-structuring protein Lsr2 n=1 Tax=Streptomyces sp. NP160 TaxID=2586637 RepID=UPI001118D3D9|nr:Lsr2 family protein [Streptomyces sp. NP160]TNM69979.1 Lsr2 family protein [Streptomyces sp. NP160]
MAQTMQVVLVDDLDGGTADQTVAFSLDGVDYEIDLSAENAARLRDDLAVWVGHARRTTAGRRARAAAGAAGAGSGVDVAAVRAWARENGHTVNERGRVPAAVVEAYRAATGA